MKSRVLNLILLLGLVYGLVGLSGCGHDGNEWERLVCEVESVNEGVPLVSAYVDVGSDGFTPSQDDVYPIDIAPVIFRARPYSTALTIPEDSPHSWFHITSYNLTWIPGAGAPAELTTYNIEGGFCDVIVPVNDEGLGSVLIADRGMKEEAWYYTLYANPGESFTANCQLEFFGHESGSDREVRIPAGMVVTFYGAISTNN